jgi:pimeloyl-ACP methyl ester carboxylesterase
MGAVGRTAVLLVLVALAATAFAGCSPRRAVETARVLEDIGAGEGASALKAATGPPHRRLVTVPVEGGAIAADLYDPADGARAAMVLVPGLAPAGKNDRRLVAFANTIARAGFAVLVPDLVRMRRLEVSAADGPLLADAAAWMAQRDPARPLGLTAISFAAGPAVLALLEPEAHGHVDFVLTIGAYYDLPAVITFFTTGAFRASPGEPWQYRTPNAYGKWVFLLSNAPRLDHPADRRALAAIARRKMDDRNADVSALVAGLGPQGRAVYALLTNDDPDRVPKLLAALPAPVRDEIAALDLSAHDLTRTQARFVLIHGRDDAIIPESESEALARALPHGAASLYILNSLDHVNPRAPGLIDTLKLFDAIYTLLGFRDGVGLADVAAERRASGARGLASAPH